MKKNKFLYLMLATGATLFGSAAIACSNPQKPEEKPNTFTEVGRYYDSNTDGERNLTLNTDKTLVLSFDTSYVTGTYTYQDGIFTFVSEDERLGSTAMYANESVSFTFDSKQYQYIVYKLRTVTFESNGGSAVEAVTVLNGKTLAAVDDPSRDGYSFVGWYTDAQLNTAFTFGASLIKSDIKLYAKWLENDPDANEFNVDFCADDGSAPIRTLRTVDGKLTSLNVTPPEKPGYTFRGWYVSDTGKADELSNRATVGMTVTQNIKLFPYYVSENAAGKLDRPDLTITSSGVTWTAVPNAASYKLTITDGEGNVKYDGELEQVLSYKYDFNEATVYTVRLVAVSLTSEANNSDPVVRTYAPNSLAKVSNFRVEDNVLLFNGVANATEYMLYITGCGNVNHDHSVPVRLGASTRYDFRNCGMTAEGLGFTVEAAANGYLSSRSDEFKVLRTLKQAENISYDETAQTVSWDPVTQLTSGENAKNVKYRITVECGDPNHVHEFDDDATTIDVSKCSPKEGGVKVNVEAYGAGYNSSSAEFTFDKKGIAAPNNVALNNTTLSWTAVVDASGYEVYVNGTTNTVNSTSVDLVTLFGLNNIKTGDNFEIKVRARDAAGSSGMWSETLNARYNVVGELKYERGALSWDPVMGASSYKLRINGNDDTVQTLSGGLSSTAVVFPIGGTNKLELCSVSADGVSAWKAVDVQVFSLSFNKLGGNGDAETAYYATGDVLRELPSELTRGGYDFVGWNTAETDGIRFEETRFTASTDVTLYAAWQGKEYTVNFDYGKYGDGEKTSRKVTFGKEFTFPTPTEITNQIKAFVGWSLNADGNGIMFTDRTGASVGKWNVASQSSTVTVYAIYKNALAFTVTYDKSGERCYAVRKGDAASTIEEITIPEWYIDEDTKDETLKNGLPVKIIGSSAFSSLSELTTLTLPSTIETIESNAFNSCSKLVNIFVQKAEGVTSYKFWDEDGVLCGHDELTGQNEIITFPRGREGSYTIPEGITSIPSDAFYFSKISELHVPYTVTNIGSAAFNISDIARLVFEATPEGKTAEPLVFDINTFKSHGDLRELTLPERSMRFYDPLAEITYTEETIDLKSFFRPCYNLSVLEVQPGSEVFTSYNSALCMTGEYGVTIVYVPTALSVDGGTYTIDSHVQAIGDKSFSGCKNIVTLKIPHTVTYVGNFAFSGYTHLTVSNGVRSTVNVSACTSLREVIFLAPADGGVAAPTTIGDYAFGYDSTEKVGSYQQSADISYAACRNLSSVVFEEGSNVVSIGKFAFAWTALGKIVIPNTVTSLGDSVFERCTSATSVEFKDGSEAALSIGENAFRNCSELTSISLPARIKEFNEGVFTDCNKLDSVDVSEDSTTLESDDGVLFDKGKKTIYYYPIGKTLADGETYELPETLETIGAGVFKGRRNITRIKIPGSVKSISNEAFSGCSNLEYVEFADGADDLEIGEKAFQSCGKLTQITLPKNLKKISDGMLSSSGITSITIPSGVTEIGASAFSQCRSLSGSITIPKTVKAIGYDAFYYCTELEEVIFEPRTSEDPRLAILDANGVAGKPESGTPAIADTFSYCTALKKVTLPFGLLNIGYGMFRASGIVEINIPATVTYIGVNAFNSCSKLEKVIFDERSDGMELELQAGSVTGTSGPPTYSAIFYSCTKLTRVDFPNGLKRLPKYLFYSCPALTEVTLPSTLCDDPDDVKNNPAIAGQAFTTCSSLTTVSVADNYDQEKKDCFTIGTNAFSSCAKLTTVRLPNTLTINGVYKAAFGSGCNMLANIVIQDGNDYFSTKDGVLYNKNMTTLVYCPVANKGAKGDGVMVIPKSVTRIADAAFNGNKQITTVNFEDADNEELPALEIGDSRTEIKDGDVKVNSSNAVFGSMTALNTVNLPARLTGIYNYSFTNSGIEHVNFHKKSKVSVIGWGTFANCAKLTSIDIPESVTAIGNSAFLNDKALATVTFNGKNLAKLGDSVFQSTGVTSITLPDSVTEFGSSMFAYAGKLTSVSLPSTIKSLTGAFTDCYSLSSLKVRVISGVESGLLSGSETTNDNGVIYSADKSTLFIYPTGKKDKTFTVPDTVKKIDASAFAQNGYLEKIIIPSSVTEIADRAFRFCTALKTVEFKQDDGSSLILGAEVFSACHNLQSVNFPKRVTTIGKQTFSYCSALNSVTFDVDTTLGAIPEKMFEYSGITSFTLPASVQTIGDYAFDHSALETFNYADVCNLTKIGNYAFQFSKLKAITIPSTVTDVGSSSSGAVFKGCTELVTAIFESASRSTFNVRGSLFSGCTSLKNVTLPTDAKFAKIDSSTFLDCKALSSIVIPDNVTEISSNAFSGCTSLSDVTLSNKLKTIGSSAFKNCSSLTTIVLPASVTSLSGTGAFAGTGITTFTIPKAVTSLTTIFSDGTSATSTHCENLKSVIFEPGSKVAIPSSFLKYQPALESVTLSEGLATVNNNAFSYSTLRSIIIPSTVTKLDYSAFAYCEQLTSVTFAKDSGGACKLSFMGNYVFQKSGLTSVIVPKSVLSNSSATSYATNWFDGCADLTSVEFEAGSVMTNLAKTATTNANMFKGCTSLKKVVLPDNLAVLGINAFQDCTALEEITLPSTMTEVPNYTFDGCTNLKRVIFQADQSGNTAINKIGDYAFSDSGLAQITIPVGVTTIGQYAFSGTDLASVTIPCNVTSIGNNAFYQCYELTQVTFENGTSGAPALTTIGNYAFRECTKLANFTIPSTVTSIGTNPFAYCRALTNLVFDTSNNANYTYENNTLYNKTKTEIILFPAGIKTEYTVESSVAEIKPFAFFGGSITKLTATNVGLTIGTYAFQANRYLTDVTLGNSAELVSNVFRYCGELVNVTLGSLTTLGEGTFDNCEKLADISIPDGSEVSLYAFTNCPSLVADNIELGENLKTEGFGATIDFEAGELTLQEGPTEIANKAFQNNTLLRSVVIPEGVTRIGQYAFDGCTELESVTLPSTLKTIDIYAFRNCAKLKNINFPESLTLIDRYAFNGALDNVEAVFGENLTKIGSYAFDGSGISKLILPSSLATADSYTFRNCVNLKHVEFKDGCKLTSFASSMFKGDKNLEYIKFHEGLTSMSSVFDPNAVEEVVIPSTVATITGTFNGWENLKKVTFAKDEQGNCALTKLASSAFKGTAITSISIPATVTSMDGAFENCGNLAEVILEKDENGECALTSLGNKTFAATALTSFSVPAKVTTIGSAFIDCVNFTTVTFEKDSEGNSALTRINADAFKNTAIEEFVVPEGVTDLYAAFAGSKLKRITLPSTIKNTGLNANLFKDCLELESVTFPDNVGTIYNSTFANCPKLKWVYIPASATINASATDGVFKDCASDMTVYFEVSAPLSTWNVAWSLYAPENIVWGVTREEAAEMEAEKAAA